MSDNFDEKKPNLPSHIGFAVKDGDKSHWREITALWPTKEGGFTQILDAYPVNGKIVFRPREELERMRAERQQNNEKGHSRDIQQKP